VIGPEPNAVFSQQQWAAIAKSIPCQEIPTKEKRAICTALMEYDLAQSAAMEDAQRSKRVKIDPKAKGRKALEQFVYYASQLRVAVSTVQRFLKRETHLDTAERVIEDIWELQQVAQRELKGISAGGRPALRARYNLVRDLGFVYTRITGNKPERSFGRFVRTIFQFQNISVKGIKHVIADVARNARNPP
jgi:hypothetical protein